ncbi:hypothetical protein PIB30_080163 [Stylosanthes scabra]|uniref:Uncharacterized protein n=1 Tax=Stylosanthes scabra TaxID=79078 RepID=A0ABU6RRQ1_9FABA|nr:hypothetical protein [Stylosanthes scabra]
MRERKCSFKREAHGRFRELDPKKKEKIEEEGKRRAETLRQGNYEKKRKEGGKEQTAKPNTAAAAAVKSKKQKRERESDARWEKKKDGVYVSPLPPTYFHPGYGRRRSTALLEREIG